MTSRELTAEIESKIIEAEQEKEDLEIALQHVHPGSQQFEQIRVDIANLNWLISRANDMLTEIPGA